MKNIIYILLSLTLIFSACCDNVYINGDLDGMWQLQKVENKNNPEETTIPQNIYYSFQRNLTFISKQDETSTPYRFLGNLYYNQEEKTVTINGLRNFPNESYVATLNDLKRFMIFNTNTVFNVLTLDNKQLIMEYDNYIYYLKRW